MSKAILFVGSLVLLVTTAVFADVTRLGRVRAPVNFRKGPSTSEPVISQLRAGEEVEVINLNQLAGIS